MLQHSFSIWMLHRSTNHPLSVSVPTYIPSRTSCTCMGDTFRATPYSVNWVTGPKSPSLQESTLAGGQHLVVLSPQQGAQVSRPINNPNLLPIPTCLLWVIQAGWCINLSELLPKVLAEAFDNPQKELHQ